MRAIELLLVITLMSSLICPIPMNQEFTSSQSNGSIWPSDSWATSTPEEQNMSSSHLNEMLDYFDENLISINSIVIVRNGHIVVEEYFDFFNENTTVSVFSCTKTVTSSLVGIAIDMGYIANTSIPILNFFQDRIIENIDARKESITIQDLLTMQAGLDWNDNSDAGMSEYNQMLRTDDWVQYVLDCPMAVSPGTVFNYNSGASLLLSAIVQNATGMTCEEFAEDYLMGPIGIYNFHWRETPQGISIGGNTLSLRAKDMARLGYLYLQNGTWNDNQVISSDWINEATQTHTIVGGGTGYGYQIWTRDSRGSYSARGYAGQYIFVVPHHDLVVVFQATSGWPNTALEDWIIPSIEEFGVPAPNEPLPFEVVVLIGVLVIIPITGIGIIIFRNEKNLGSRTS